MVSGSVTSTPPVPVNVTGAPAVALPKAKSSAASFTELFIAIAFLIFPVRLYLYGSPVFARLIAPDASRVSFDIEAANENPPVEKSTSPSSAMSPTEATKEPANPEISAGTAIAMLIRGTFAVRFTALIVGSDGTLGVNPVSGPDDQASWPGLNTGPVSPKSLISGRSAVSKIFVLLNTAAAVTVAPNTDAEPLKVIVVA